MTTDPSFGPASPFFIVQDIQRALPFYKQLGFEVRFLAKPEDPFFAIVGRGQAQLFLKAVDPSVPPIPNRQRHEWARWDAFIYAADPDGLAAELNLRGVTLHSSLGDLQPDGLRGFEVRDRDGYVLFLGRPI